MSHTAILFKDIVRRYNDKTVLQGVNLAVEKGEFFALIGMNGAGKTTLLKCLLDFCVPEEGSIELFGVGNRQTQARTPLAFLPERFMPPLLPDRRGFSEICAGAAIPAFR